MWQWTSGAELYHYGIKGQRWGVRRFQNEDGTLTPAGKERYDDDNDGTRQKTKEEKKAEKQLNKEYKKQRNEEATRNKSKLKFLANLHEDRVNSLIEKYKKTGISDEEAKVEAKKRAKAEAVVAGVAAVTVASLGIYAMHKHKEKMNMTDRVLDSDTEFQRIVALAQGGKVNTNHRLYVAYDEKDKRKYLGMYGSQLLKENGSSKSVNKVTLKADGPIRIASRDRAAKVFMDMYNGDPGFKKHFEDNILPYADVAANNKFAGFKAMYKKGDMTQANMFNRGYELFNVALVDDNPTSRKYADQFYSKLLAQGMNAIEDRNDKLYSGYKSKDPLITFGVKYNYTTEVVSNEEVARESLKVITGNVASTLARSGAMYVAGKGIKLYNTQHEDARMIREYKEQHPNSELNDDEIIKMLKPYRK